MSNNEQIEAIRYAHKENDMPKGRIWKVFFYLLGLTALEFIIALGFVETGIIEKGIFVITVYIILTLMKAYYIVGYFMHLNFDTKGFKIMLGLPLILIVYLIILVLIEGEYIGIHLFK